MSFLWTRKYENGVAASGRVSLCINCAEDGLFRFVVLFPFVAALDKKIVGDMFDLNLYSFSR